MTQVREYILIGEAEGGICGKQGTTWGRHWRQSAGNVIEHGQGVSNPSTVQEAPMFEGFVRVDLPDLSSLQMCCTDERWQPCTNSRTVSFRRVSDSHAGIPLEQHA